MAIGAIMPDIQFTGVMPILRLSDFDASLSYYVDVLGFTVRWRAGRFGCVGRGDASIMLCEGEQGHPGTWVYVSIDDADALYQELRGRGARIRHTPRNFPWGARELHVFDLDGHVLRFGSDTLAGEPLGDWLDENGVLWSPQSDGSWRKAE